MTTVAAALAAQPDLFRRAAERDFWVFHADNPQVYRLFCKFADDVVRSGRSRYSARTILHRIRWYTTVETDDPTASVKINDHWSPFYARLYEKDHPNAGELFEKRRSIADEAAA